MVQHDEMDVFPHSLHHNMKKMMIFNRFLINLNDFNLIWFIRKNLREFSISKNFKQFMLSKRCVRIFLAILTTHNLDNWPNETCVHQQHWLNFHWKHQMHFTTKPPNFLFTVAHKLQFYVYAVFFLFISLKLRPFLQFVQCIWFIYFFANFSFVIKTYWAREETLHFLFGSFTQKWPSLMWSCV